MISHASNNMTSLRGYRRVATLERLTSNKQIYKEDECPDWNILLSYPDIVFMVGLIGKTPLSLVEHHVGGGSEGTSKYM
jgi:hypothetical protein